MAQKRKELLTNRVKDLRINGKTTISDFILQCEASGGFTSSKIAVAHTIMEKIVKEQNTTFLSFPADIISTGTRGVIIDMIKKGIVDVIITTTGTIDHDIARTLSDYYCGTFEYDDRKLKDMGINRLGSVFVPDESYGSLIEEFMMKHLESLYSEKKSWAPSEILSRIGKKLGNTDSILAAAAEKNIPIFIPGIPDGSVGSQFWSFYETHSDFQLDILKDQHLISDIVFTSDKAGAIMIGGGISKHHTIWWNQFRGGLDYAIYITTAQEYDGSLSGAKLEEAISWKKVKPDAEFVNVYGDATVLLPLIVAGFL
ncbi:MAG: deoxyhypusine synthase [Thermoplasmataceae archaeon]